MTQNETYAAFALVALLAYGLGVQKAKASAVPVNYDPLDWLNQYTTA